MEEISTLDSKYYQIGMGLRLKPKDLQSIEEMFRQEPSRALGKVVETWLQQQYNVKKCGPPTWQMLVKAVDSPAGGNDHTLAKKIASKHAASKYMHAHEILNDCHNITMSFTHSAFLTCRRKFNCIHARGS